MNKEILLPYVCLVALGVPFKQHFSSKKYTSVSLLSPVRKKGHDKDHASTLPLYDYHKGKLLLPSIFATAFLAHQLITHISFC